VTLDGSLRCVTPSVHAESDPAQMFASSRRSK
jgi:hypothetical protein